MAVYKGKITSLGDYTEITTTVVRDDGYGQGRVGMYDRQKERFIDGMTIGDRTFGRLSCPANLYPCLQVGQEVELHTWVHPFLGVPPLRTGIVGVVYPDQNRAYVIGLGQTALSLLLLALLPILWILPGFVVGGALSALLHLPGLLSGLVAILITFSPWIAAGLMIWSVLRIRSAYPSAQTPSMRA
ncbi:MAG: hypothetical protein JSS35_06135 [Proteobacteria bacterium]|nr:hypothetical protein [Pseudomonadota bacterium]